MEGADLSQELPREYRIGGWGRRYLLGIGWFSILAGLGAVWYFILVPDETGDRYAYMILGGFFSLLAIPVLASAYRTRVVLHADAVETRGIFVVKRMERGDIAGRRRASGDGPAMLVLVPKNTRVRSLKVPQYIATDAIWDRWFASIPDFDEDERKKALANFLKDPDLVGSDEDKLGDLALARRIAQGLLYASLIAIVWAWFYPKPYDLVLSCLAILPLTGIAVASAGGAAYRFNVARNDVAADLSPALLIPGLMLMVRAMLDISVLDWGRMCLLAAAATAVCALLLFVFLKELRQNRGSLGVAILLMAPYAFGASLLANVHLDRSVPAVHATTIVEARVDKDNGRTYHLKLAPWGARTESKEIKVGQDFYARVSPGHTVCVYLHGGALDVPWFVVGNCAG
jgi:hypothetical protein